MFIASPRPTSLIATLVLASFTLLLAACGEAPSPGRADSAASGDAADRGSATGDESGAALDDAAVTGDSLTPEARDSARAAVTDSIGFPAGKKAVPGQRYNIRSGIIELKSTFMGDLRQTIYFDEFGRKEAVYANATIDDKTTRSVMVMANGQNIIYDPEKKSGTRIDMADALSQLGLGGIPNLSSLDDNAKRELKYRPIAGRTVLGKPTIGAAIDVMGTAVNVWTWEGIPLRMEATMQGNTMMVEATSLKTDVAVPADRFVVPKEIRITDYKNTP